MFGLLVTMTDFFSIELVKIFYISYIYYHVDGLTQGTLQNELKPFVTN